MHRKIHDSWVWDDKPFSRGQAWIDMLLMANHCENKVPFGGKIIAVEAGSFITSELKLMNRWGWSKTKLRSFLSELISDGMIYKNTDRKKTTITIVNYGIYQNSQTIEKPQKDHRKTDERPIKDTNNNDNNENNENKYNKCVPFESFWKLYPRKKEKAKAYKAYCARLKDGYSEDELLQAVKAYAEECRSRNTEEKYIKLGATFLSSSTPFTDYIGGKENGSETQSRTTVSDFYGQLLECCNREKS